MHALFDEEEEPTMSIPAPITGFLGDAMTLSTTSTGKVVARGRVGCPDEYRNGKGEWTERDTVWVPIQAWGTLAERLADLPKGAPIVGIGEWRQSNYQDEQGNNRSSRYVRLSAAGPDWSKRPSGQPAPAVAEESEASESTPAPSQPERVETKAEENPL